ncbi:hypothetical protein NMY22_g2115 [Coprinellus aureogranulatus]|nr:hypothetical protein NMY22_g2115 [Coprinellus aureogranulatus]
MKITSLAGILSLVVYASGRTFTVYNNCPFTIWPAIFTDLNVGSAVPDHPNGWEAPTFSNVSFVVPNTWRAGRIWGRRNCDFNKPGSQSCLTGSCNGGLFCDKVSGTGAPPVTLAEFTFDGTNDHYDVSLVDGYNLPMRISPTAGCPVAECAKDLGPDCPAPLKGPFDSSGFPVGCRSACTANIDGNPADSRNCCSGRHNNPATCPSSGVAFYDYFKSNCPKTYAYAYDESSGTSLFHCPAGIQANYTITFCP